MRSVLMVCGLLLGLAAAGCGRTSGVVSAAGPPPAPLVSVIEVQPEDVPLYSEYAARRLRATWWRCAGA